MKLQPYILTFLAEELGKRQPFPIRSLELLANHPSELVREGAIYGLSRQVRDPKVRKILERVAYGDPNPIVRGCALEALE